MIKKFLPIVIAAGLFANSGFAAAEDDRMKGLSPGVDGSVVPRLTKVEQLAPCRVDDIEGAHVLLTLKDVLNSEGNIRVQVYGGNPEDFLARGKKLVRIDVPAEKRKSTVCVTFPKSGQYALAILHDRNANGRTEFLTEGFGFSRNPNLSFSAPDHDEVVIDVQKGVRKEVIKMKYVFKSNEQNRRRKKRRE